ncbi:DUF3324 domain-containing protein [Elizabethkingia sp. HX WHF]|uniref:DUF3324 domain-containing protein n=1 Tax=Elizabethkingia bruuniana TaxID=1756149 RepID=A0A7T7UWS6_9FLAO|nr:MULTISPECIES: DUF3324 domain-containing protein [Elizabethkingia]KGO10120.1 hypothetical protein KS04_10295 [Elizabethkingia miricola]AQX84190.1 hypothetical protein AYC65_03760 [Elizabethkingia bruuniana]KUY28367.1 hypothetical protein ATB97_15755 [Elizabethkingia bruuniana]MCL1638615.1 DUF3324 domain-containing protein [Elizabethkingia bruuniana]MDX8564354.1 DUF3324 domain-containing protein [Elizabethkingia sp. HX WHF]
MLKRILYIVAFIMQFGPLHASIVVLNGLTHNYKVENGHVYKGKIAIENTGSTSQNVKIYLQDFSYKSDGSVNYTIPLTNTKTNADWIKLNTNLLTLKAKEKTEVFYEIVVPDKITQAGSYWSVLIVEPVDDIKPSDKKIGVSITSVVRYAIQVITDYKTENTKPDLKFEGVKVDNVEGKRMLKIAIANKGSVYCKPTLSAEIYSIKNGQKINNLTSMPMGLLPDSSKSFYIDISKIPPDKYKAVIIATDENENAFALNVELEIKND